MDPILVAPDEDYRTVLTHWRILGMMVESGGTEHIVTSIDAFLDFGTIQSMVINPKGEVSRVMSRGCLKIRNTQTEKNSNANSKNIFVSIFLNLPPVSRCTGCGRSLSF